MSGSPFQEWARELCGIEPEDTRLLIDRFRDELLKSATRDIGIRESRPNDGPEIREWLADVGIHSPAAYCAAWVSSKIVAASAAVHLVRIVDRDVIGKLPLEPTPAALKLAYNAQRIGAFVPYKGGAYTFERADVLIFKRPGAAWQGHCALVEVVNEPGSPCQTIEANVPDQRGREGVVDRLRRPDRDSLFLGHISWARVPLLSGGQQL